MPAATFSVDTIVNIYNNIENRQIGSKSLYATIPHPGTNKTITGWMWDNRAWPTQGEFDAVAYAPSIWDPSTSGLVPDDFQSGYGDNDDLLLRDILEVNQISGEHTWSPEIHHGYFYVNDEEWYLYSDSHLAEFFNVTGVDDQGNMILQLSHEPKMTIPIQVRTYEYDRVLDQYFIDRDFRKKVEFEPSGVQHQFKVDTSTSPFTLVISGVLNTEIGPSITLTSSGTADYDSMQDLELVGISEGFDNQTFQLQYCPLDPGKEVQIWVYANASYPVPYSGIQPNEEFLAGSSQEVRIDRETGRIEFGDYDAVSGAGAGRIPPDGHRIAAHYTKGIEARYEPKDTKDTHLAYNSQADINPANNSTERGFVQLSSRLADPASLVLTSDLPTGSPHQINLGNNIGALTATAYDKAGKIVEGVDVTFEILAPRLGSLGGVNDVFDDTTDALGEAHAIFNAPSTIDQIGATTSGVTHSGADTVMEFEMQAPTTVSGFYLYKIHEYDEAQGIHETQERQYYDDYLDEQGISSGVQATVEFEQDFRTGRGLDVFETYDPTEVFKGKKTIILTQKSVNIVDPHSGVNVPNTFAPLYPDAIDDIGTSDDPRIRVTYSGLLLPQNGEGDTKAYFGVGEASTQVRASMRSPRSNKTVYSNTLDIDVNIGPEANGTVIASALSDIPSGLLYSKRDIDDITLDEILTYSGVLYNEYLLERSGISTLLYDYDEIDQADAFAYWGLDNLSTVGTSEVDGVDLVSSGLSGDSPNATNDALFGTAYETTTSGQYMAVTTNTFDPDRTNLASGMFITHMRFKDLWAGDGASGAIYDATTLNALLWGDNTNQNSFSMAAGNMAAGGDGKLRIVMSFAGGVAYLHYIDWHDYNDTAWHRFRVAWEIVASTTASGIARFGTYIDGIEVYATSDVQVALPTTGPSGTLTPVLSLWQGIDFPAPPPNPILAVYDETAVMNTPVFGNIEFGGIENFVGEDYETWFRRTHRADSALVGLNQVITDPDSLPAEIPLGWRLKGAGSTIASALDRVTYIDPNPHLTSGYFGL